MYVYWNSFSHSLQKFGSINRIQNTYCDKPGSKDEMIFLTTAATPGQN